MQWNTFVIVTLMGSMTLLTGCSFFGTPVGQDRVEANTLEQEIANYKEWKAPDFFDGYHKSRHPLPEFVKYYANDTLLNSIDNPANGSIVVKEQFDQDKKFIGLTVMKRIDGYAPEHGDWYWAIADTDVEITNAGKLNSIWTSSCIDCHKHKGDYGNDLLFIND